MEGLVGLDGEVEDGLMFWVEGGESVGQDELKGYFSGLGDI